MSSSSSASDFPRPATSTRLQRPPPAPSSPTSFKSSFTSSSSAVASSSSVVASTTTGAGLPTIAVSSTPSPSFQTTSLSKSQNLPLGLIFGASVAGMVLGALLVFLFFLYQRRRAQRPAPNQGNVPYTSNADEEKAVPVPRTLDTADAASNAKVLNWMHRNGLISVSSISSFSSPTVVESGSVGARTSMSAYSQASAIPSRMSVDLNKPEEEAISRPPGLYRIAE
ncbi:hypothetical protein B0H15DRAFT_1026245 [Mycena belliarum]|uniref:Uncharacterized protein n=1 Tax=Mycena belliarum TaxID=1033014 RepID=A0AAD6XGI0_9AGAR|nr:hypothetical protein B0H15DRAFT_1026245 [Mycena belliae]